jgi:uncharacterized protein YjdB
MTMRRIPYFLILVLGVTAFVACKSVKTISLIPPQAILNAKDASTLLRASAKDDNGAVMENATITWSSSSPDVATVENGKVVALKSGDATITAASGKVTSEAKVIVSIPASIEVTPSTVEILGIGASSMLSALVKDDLGKVARAPVVWKSADEKVVRVINGHLMSQGVGTTTVTATAGSFNAAATVTVKTPEIAKLQIEPAKNALEAAGAAVQLSVKAIDPKGAPIVGVPTQWSSSDDKTATVTPTGLVRAVKKGKAKITAKMADKTAVAEVTVKK